MVPPTLEGKALQLVIKIIFKFMKLFICFLSLLSIVASEGFTKEIDLNNKIKTAKKPVYLFGAHIFSSFLLFPYDFLAPRSTRSFKGL